MDKQYRDELAAAEVAYDSALRAAGDAISKAKADYIRRKDAAFHRLQERKLKPNQPTRKETHDQLERH